MEQSGQKAKLEDFVKAIEQISPTGVMSASCSSSDPFILLPEENSYLEDIKSSKRVLHFSMGRTAARLALKKLPDIFVEKGHFLLARLESGAVAWPKGVIGSITHSQDLALAIVAQSKDFQALGLDLEYHRNIDPEVVGRVASREELALLKEFNNSIQQDFFAIFTSKEAIFKTIFPLINKKFGFEAVRLKSVKTIAATAPACLVLALEFEIIQHLSDEFPSGQSLNSKLFSCETFSLSLCPILGNTVPIQKC